MELLEVEALEFEALEAIEALEALAAVAPVCTVELLRGIIPELFVELLELPDLFLPLLAFFDDR